MREHNRRPMPRLTPPITRTPRPYRRPHRAEFALIAVGLPLLLVGILVAAYLWGPS